MESICIYVIGLLGILFEKNSTPKLSSGRQIVLATACKILSSQKNFGAQFFSNSTTSEPYQMLRGH